MRRSATRHIIQFLPIPIFIRPSGSGSPTSEVDQKRKCRVRAAPPFHPQDQTSSACPGMSVWCQ